MISPLLANAFLHYGFDLWVAQWRKREAKGRVIVVRGSRSGPSGAKRFWHAMSERLGKFGLELHEGKTSLLEFGPST